MRLTILFAAIAAAQPGVDKNCGRRLTTRSGYMVGGSVAKPLEFPWQASLQMLTAPGNEKALYPFDGAKRLSIEQLEQFWTGEMPQNLESVDRAHLYSAVVLNDRWAIAPFVYLWVMDSKELSTWVLSVPALAPSIAVQTGRRRPNEYRICKAIRYPYFEFPPPARPDGPPKPGTVLLRIYGSFSQPVSPICLPGLNWKTYFPPETRCLVSSWNTTRTQKFYELVTSIVYKESYTILDPGTCRSGKYPKLPRVGNLICTANRALRREQFDLTLNDRGSPLSCLHNGQYYVVGFFVHPNFGESVDYFDDIGNLHDWITKTIEFSRTKE